MGAFVFLLPPLLKHARDADLENGAKDFDALGFSCMKWERVSRVYFVFWQQFFECCMEALVDVPRIFIWIC